MNEMKDCGPQEMIRPAITAQRKRELLKKAEDAADWLMQHNIKPHELCTFRRMVELLVAEDF